MPRASLVADARPSRQRTEREKVVTFVLEDVMYCTIDLGAVRQMMMYGSNEPSNAVHRQRMHSLFLRQLRLTLPRFTPGMWQSLQGLHTHIYLTPWLSSISAEF